MAGKELKSKKRNHFSSNDDNIKKEKRNRIMEFNDRKRRRGPRLPNALQKELSILNNAVNSDSDADDDVNLNNGSNDDALLSNDVYEYEEDVPEEESKKNRRFDPVENYEYELPEDFKDSDISEDEGDDEEGDDLDEGRHGRMLEELTGLPTDAFGGKRKRDVVISEAYPESEYNPSRDILDGDGRISIEDLLDPLQGKSGFSKLRKNLHRMEKKLAPTLAPLPTADRERLERKAAYEHTKKDITKWEPLVKRNREAPTLYFDDDVDLGFSTIGAIASEFEPRTEFEKKMASLLNQDELVEAQKKDGARLHEMNKLSAEDFMDRHNRLAKMRSLLFRHEMKSKRIKKIKSKTYHRLLKKDRNKAVESSIQTDPEAAKELAMKREFKRAEERMTLKHKNSNKWAKRILQRGLNAQDEATRQAFGEQLHQHAALTRKMNSLKDSSSDESSDDSDSDDASAGSDHDNSSKLLMKAKEKTLKALAEGDDELPKSGVLSLPFMERGLRKRQAAADEEARLALEEYESSLRQLEGTNSLGIDETVPSSGRRAFGVAQKVVHEPSKKVEVDNFYGDSDGDDNENKEDGATEDNQNANSLKEVDIDHNILREAFDLNHDYVLKSFKDFEDPEPKTSYEVSFLASDSWRKVKSSSDFIKQTDDKKSVPESEVTIGDDNQNMEEDDDSGSDIDGETIVGFLSSRQKSSYKLPSQAELIERAFAGDDVLEDFEKDKEAVLDEEIPQPEKPTLLPGWGQWTDIQRKKGIPSWMLQEHDTAKKKRAEALKKRKDAHLDHVIISEKLDKKAEKLHIKSLPYPYTSKEVFEQSIRMPIGPEFNPASTVGALNRPEVVKKSGIIIKPIQYEDMNVSAKVEPRKQNHHQKQRNGIKAKNKSSKKV